MLDCVAVSSQYLKLVLMVLLAVGILCLFGGPIANRIGLNWTLLLGAVGYPIYSYVSPAN